MKLEEIFPVSGIRCLITGSTRGIGRALAPVLVGLGVEVWVHGRRDDTAAAVGAELGCNWVSGDLGNPDDLDRIQRRIRRETDRLDAIINNAGVELLMPVEEIDRATLEQSLQVNLVAPILLVQGLLDLLKASGSASVINVTSIHDAVPYPHNAVYSATKAALAMFTRTAALELAPYGIRMNNVAPGAVETEINHDVIDSIGRHNFEEWIPAGRVGTTADLVGTVVLLLSKGSNYTTGSTVYVDGGYMQNLVRYRP